MAKMFMWYLDSGYQMVCALTTLVVVGFYGFYKLGTIIYDKFVTKKHFRDSY